MGRTLIVGDVHGCAAELEELLSRVALSPSDQLLFVGDLIARGPDTRRVLAIVRQTGARSVLGNHEEHLLAARAGRRAPARSHQSLLDELDEADFALLESLPRTLELADHGIVIVHAGVVPGLPLAEQDPWALTHMRSIDASGRATSRREPPLWASRYTGPPHVVFGHDALSGLQLEPWATGLDTACVYGHALTALVLPEGQALSEPADRRELLVSVPARSAYFRPS